MNEPTTEVAALIQRAELLSALQSAECALFISTKLLAKASKSLGSPESNKQVSEASRLLSSAGLSIIKTMKAHNVQLLRGDDAVMCMQAREQTLKGMDE